MKYQKVAECPTKLEKWLVLINSAPYGQSTHLRGWEILMSNAYFELTGEDIRLLDAPAPYFGTGEWDKPGSRFDEIYQEVFTKATEALKEETKEFPKLFSYLFEIENYPPSKNHFDEIRFDVRTWQYARTAYQRYETFLQMRVDIRDIAFECKSYRQTGRFIDNQVVLEQFGFKRRDKGYRSDFIIKNGAIDFESELIQLLRGVSPERLRVCPICREVFWVKRIDAPTCPEKRCSNNFHQRKLRIAEYEKRLAKAFEKLEKQRQTLPSDSPLIAEQIKLTNKIIEKINREKMKNGTL